MVDQEFIKPSLYEKINLYVNYNDKANKEIDISSYQKKSQIITNEKLKKLKVIDTKEKFKKFFKEYNIHLLLDIDMKDYCITINYVTKYITNKKSVVCNHNY
jgi:hypothetical protein